MDKGNEQKKFLIKVLCVLLSFGLWLYITNVENPTRTYDLKNVPVELTNIDILESSNLALSPNQKFYVDLKLEGPANELYSVKQEDIKIKADLSAYALKKGENNIPVEIINYPQNISIKSNGYLVVKVNIESLLKKEVKVYSKVKLSFKEGYSQASIDVKPSVVNITGAESEVNKVVGATLVGDVENISEDFNSKFPIKAVDDKGDIVENVVINEDEGTLALKIGVSKTVNIKSKLVGQLPSGLTLDEVELSKSTIGLIGDPKILGSLTSIETEPINLANITSSKSLDVKLVLPEGVKTVNGEEYVTAKIKISAKEPVEKTITANITYLNLDSKFKHNGPATIPIIISANEDVISTISANNIKVEVDLSAITAEGEHTVSWKASIVNSDNSVKISNNTGNITINITLK